MRKRRRIVVLGIVFFAMLMVNIHCGSFSVFRNNSPKFKRIPVTDTLITKYNFDRKDYQLLYYYLSDQIILDVRNPDAQFQTTADHKGERWTRGSDRIIFEDSLRGRYVRHDEKYFGDFWGKLKDLKLNKLFEKDPRFRFVIHFEDPPMNLEFLQNDDGNMELLTHTNKRGQKVLYFDSKEYVCLRGEKTIIEIDERQLSPKEVTHYYVKPATFEEPKSRCSVCTILIGMGVVFLLALLVDNSEQ